MTQKFGVVVMGVSGCGKSTFGAALADQLECPFIEGDDVHPPDNIKKMASGRALTDKDRWPWLNSLAEKASNHWQQTDAWVVSCSALKPAYRDRFRLLAYPVLFVHLELTRDQLKLRLNQRSDHFMPTSLLESQFNTLFIESRETDIFNLASNQSLAQMLHAFQRHHNAAEF